MSIKRSILLLWSATIVALLITAAWHVATGPVYAADRIPAPEGLETGVWVVSSPSSKTLWLHSVSAADTRGTQFTSVAYRVLDDPARHENPPAYDMATPTMGSIVKVGANSYKATWISYEVKEIKQRPAQIMTIQMSHANFQFVDKDTAKGTLTLMIYSGAQDVDGDGLPDKGKEPIATYENMEYTGKRLKMIGPS